MRGMGATAFAVGIVVLLATLASQTGLGPDDFVTVAGLGVLGAVFCLFVAVRSRSRAAIGGFVLSLLPIALLVYFLAVSDG
jgi:hypothetical protein